MGISYGQWINGGCGCQGGTVITGTSACSCDNILLEISNLHTDDLVLQEQIDELSGGCDCDLSDYYTKEEVNELIPTVPSLDGYVTNATLIQYVTNLQEQINSIIAEVSGCCSSSGETQYRWITETGENDYWCSGTTKMAKEKEQSSTDGITWTDTGNERSGSTVLEKNCTECGYVPSYSGNAFIWHNYSGDTNIINITNNCNNVSGSIIAKRNDQYAPFAISGCSTTIDYNTLPIIGESNYDNRITYLVTGNTYTIPASQYSGTDITMVCIFSGCTSIGDYAYANCQKLTTVDIGIPHGVSLPIIVNDEVVFEVMQPQGEEVASIGDYAFANCINLKWLTLNEATTVPTLGTGAFDGCTSLNKIYVPSTLVNAFKTAPGWSNYASIIQKIN